MANTEKDDYKIFRKNICKPLDRMDRIENVVGNGTPDINYCAEGRESWIELKSPKEPKRVGTTLFGSNHRLSTDQKNWFLSQQNAGGNGYILIATDVRWILISGKHADLINTATVEYLLKLAIWSAERIQLAKNKYHWAMCRDILTGKINAE